jgi:hypothetical protein
MAQSIFFSKNWMDDAQTHLGQANGQPGKKEALRTLSLVYSPGRGLGGIGIDS